MIDYEGFEERIKRKRTRENKNPTTK